MSEKLFGVKNINIILSKIHSSSLKKCYFILVYTCINVYICLPRNNTTLLYCAGVCTF